MDSEKLIQLRQKDLSKLTPRQRGILKLLFALGPLTELESEKVLPAFKSEVGVVKMRKTEEVAMMFGRTRQRIHQIQTSLFEKLGI